MAEQRRWRTAIWRVSPQTGKIRRRWTAGTVRDRSRLRIIICRRGRRSSALAARRLRFTGSILRTSRFRTTISDLDGWNGPGPFTITNNYLSAGTEIVGFGGAPVAIYGQHPSNITISNNYFYRDPAWRSAGYWVKNDIEL